MISSGWNLANLHSIWKVGMNSKINILDSNWLGVPLALSPCTLNYDALSNLNVGSLLTNNIWNVDIIHNLLGHDLIDQVLDTPISETDLVSWGKHIDPFKISGSLYSSLFQSSSSWDWLWSSTMPAKSKIFSWRLCLGGLPFNSKLANWGLRNSNLCSWGCGTEDTPEHISCYCLYTQCVWAALGTLGFTPVKPSSLSNLLNLAKSHKALPFNLILTFLSIHYAWYAKNEFDHNSKFTLPLTCAFNIINSLNSAIVLTDRKCWGDIRPLRSSHHLWHPPPFGWLKFNIDGSFLTENQASIGIVCRDNLGRIIVACGGPILANGPTHCEVSAGHYITHILEDWMFELKGIIIEGDCRSAMGILAREFGKTLRNHGSDGLGPLRRFRTVLFSSCSRVDNRLADAYCRLGRDRWFLCRGSSDPCAIPGLIEEEIPP